MKLVEGIAKILVFLIIDGKEPGKDHGLRLAISRKRFIGRIVTIGKGITHVNGLGVLEIGNDIADFPNAELIHGSLRGTLDTDAIDQKGIASLHHQKLVSLFNGSIENADRGDNASVLIEI